MLVLIIIIHRLKYLVICHHALLDPNCSLVLLLVTTISVLSFATKSLCCPNLRSEVFIRHLSVLNNLHILQHRSKQSKVTIVNYTCLFSSQLDGDHGQNGVRAWKHAAQASAWGHVNAWPGPTAGDLAPRQESARFRIVLVSGNLRNSFQFLPSSRVHIRLIRENSIESCCEISASSPKQFLFQISFLHNFAL